MTSEEKQAIHLSQHRDEPTAGATLLNLQEASESLGYSVKGLRKIIDLSRAKANGKRTRGPTIKFFQVGSGSPIRFRPEWIEDSINENTVDPGAGNPIKSNPPPYEKRKNVPLDF